MGDNKLDAIQRIEITYRRTTKFKPRIRSEGATCEYLTWGYSDRLIIDGPTDTLEITSVIGSGCQVGHTYHVEEGITSFLEQWNVDLFSHIPYGPPDAIEDPMESKDYVITVLTKQGNKRIITGTYDRDGLPEDWAEFIEGVVDFVRFYGIGEIFNNRLYKKPKRRKSDLIFCKVEFEEHGQVYTYLADSDNYAVDDRVIVPAGRENHEAVVRIVEIEYCQPENAPFPVEKTKHILRKHEKTDNHEG